MKTRIAVAVVLLCALASSKSSGQVPPFVLSWGSYGNGNTQFLTPVGVAVDGDGIVYVVDSNLHSLKRFTRAGMFLSQWHVTSPRGIALGPDGYVYVTQTTDAQFGAVSKFTKDGAPVGQWRVDNGTGIAVDIDGSVYVTVGGGTADVIQKFTSSGTLVKQWGGRGVANGMFWGLDGVAVDGAGHIYTAEEMGSRVQKFSTDGTFLLKWSIPGPVGSGFATAVRLAVSRDGSLVYVVNNFNQRVEIYTSTGAFVGQWGAPGSGPGKFLNPIGIALDRNGNVFVADTNNSRIQVFGNAATPATSISWGHLKSLFR